MRKFQLDKMIFLATSLECQISQIFALRKNKLLAQVGLDKDLRVQLEKNKGTLKTHQQKPKKKKTFTVISTQSFKLKC